MKCKGRLRQYRDSEKEEFLKRLLQKLKSGEKLDTLSRRPDFPSRKALLDWLNYPCFAHFKAEFEEIDPVQKRRRVTGVKTVARTNAKWNPERRQVEAIGFPLRESSIGGILNLSPEKAERLPDLTVKPRIRLIEKSSFDFETEEEITLYKIEIESKPGLGKFINRKELEQFIEQVL